MRHLGLLGLLLLGLAAGCGTDEERREDPHGATISGRVFYHRDVFYGSRQTQGWYDDNPAYVIVEGTEVQTPVDDDSSGDFGTYRLTHVPTDTAYAISAIREGYAKHTIEVRLDEDEHFTFDFDLFPNVTVLITSVGVEPASFRIPRGTVVTWVNVDDRDRSHRVWNDQSPFVFDSHDIPPNASFSYTFDRVGTAQYTVSGVEFPSGEIEAF